MTDHPTAGKSTSTVGLWLVALAALFVAASAGVAFFIAGILEAPEPADPDYLWHPWRLLEEHETTVGLVSLVVFVAAGATLIWARRTGRLPSPLPAQVIVVALFAAWLGFGYQIVTAGVTGANIGGGGVILVTPVLALATIPLRGRIRNQGFTVDEQAWSTSGLTVRGHVDDECDTTWAFDPRYLLEPMMRTNGSQRLFLLMAKPALVALLAVAVLLTGCTRDQADP